MTGILNINKFFAAGLFALLLGISFMGVPAVSTVSAEIKDELCGGAELKLSSAACEGDCIARNSAGNCTRTKASSSETKLNSLITTIVNVLSVIIGILAVIMIIIGGAKFITSGGDSGKVSSAKTTVIYALVGLIIVALAQFIVRFVLSKT